ncbi:hypothetical protein A3F29_04305 [Candidatus Roizmanbacteria bacterium RIFCSPHIGHO2_12_FULL_33_9]|uniref:Uncharacterized protein n=1 Tax=Candidatus Roizmanbacteria bacterium RIFCSPHIGHO2_12_FULL_33_9 TaxID=1802045 RepID=A0A1F7HIB5_9BACT|nr:MAG: hypothetical protein A3F29_04305 [Candidatus Roizmanbacteria bacterium RIFCSPHIGHO2_12_FULL_33_9]
MERRQIIMLVIVILVIIALKVLNDKYADRVETENKKTIKILDEEGQVEGIAEKFDEGLRSAEEQTGNIIENATTFVSDQVSRASESVTNVVIKNTTQNIVNQIEKLPENNQTQIKELICK